MGSDLYQVSGHELLLGIVSRGREKAPVDSDSDFLRVIPNPFSPQKAVMLRRRGVVVYRRWEVEVQALGFESSEALDTVSI